MLGKLFGSKKTAMTVIAPWSQQRGFKGRHRGVLPGRHRKPSRGSGVFPGIRLTALTDRGRGYFR